MLISRTNYDMIYKGTFYAGNKNLYKGGLPGRFIRMKEEFITLKETDLTDMVQLYREAFTGPPWNDDWSDGERLKVYMKEISGGYNSLNFGLRIDDRLVAMSVGMIRHWWEGVNYNIEELCVLPEFQGQGVGTRFLKRIEKEIQTKGFAGIFLQTDSDKPSYSFYHKLGFFDLGAHVSLYRSLPANIVPAALADKE